MSSSSKILLKPCVASIEIEANVKASNIALNEYSLGDEANKLVIWSDASHRRTGSGLAMVWRTDPVCIEWSARVFVRDSSFDNNLAEFFAFYQAIHLARERCDEDITISKVVVYTDSQTVLCNIRDFHKHNCSRRGKFSRQKELAQIKTLAKELQSIGVEVIFRWAPGHSQIPGNVEADQLAYQASAVPYEHSHLDRLVPPSDEYLENPTKKAAKDASKLKILKRQAKRHAKIKKTAVSRESPSRKVYDSRVEIIIHDMEAGIQGSLLDVVEQAIDGQIAEN